MVSRLFEAMESVVSVAVLCDQVSEVAEVEALARHRPGSEAEVRSGWALQLTAVEQSLS